MFRRVFPFHDPVFIGLPAFLVSYENRISAYWTDKEMKTKEFVTMRDMNHKTGCTIEEPVVRDTGKGNVAQKWRELAEEYGERIAELTGSGKSIKEISHITGLSEYYVKSLNPSLHRD